MPVSPEISPFIVEHAQAWRLWLDTHESESDGVWLVLAKKGTTEPTTLSYAQALEEALCSGWIDGQKRSRDAATFLQRFTPRRSASMWSQRNIGIVAGLIEEGRMRERGHSEIARAQADGRWDRAYAGAASVEVPADLRAAISAVPGGTAQFEALSSQDRYALILRVITAATPETRARRISRFCDAVLSAPPAP